MSNMPTLSWGNRLLALITGQVRSPSILDEPIHEYSAMTLDRWNQSPTRVQWAKDQMANRYFREMVGVLQNTSLSIKSEKLEPTTAAFLLGWQQGAQFQVLQIISMGQNSKPPLPEVTADYSEPNEPIESE